MQSQAGRVFSSYTSMRLWDCCFLCIEGSPIKQVISRRRRRVCNVTMAVAAFPEAWLAVSVQSTRWPRGLFEVARRIFAVVPAEAKSFPEGLGIGILSLLGLHQAPTCCRCNLLSLCALALPPRRVFSLPHFFVLGNDRQVRMHKLYTAQLERPNAELLRGRRPPWHRATRAVVLLAG